MTFNCQLASINRLCFVPSLSYRGKVVVETRGTRSSSPHIIVTKSLLLDIRCCQEITNLLKEAYLVIKRIRYRV